MKSKYLLAAFIIGWSAAVHAFEFPKNEAIAKSIGFADKRGKAMSQFSLGYLKLSENDLIPLNYFFSGDPDGYDSHFGKGFSIPFLESRLVEETSPEKRLKWSSIDGKTYYFYKYKGTPNGTFYTPGRDWKAVQDEQQTILSKEGSWQFSYRRGRLNAIKTTEGNLYRFNYNSHQRLTHIHDKNFNKVFEAGYFPGGEFPKLFEFEGWSPLGFPIDEENPIEFEYSDIDVVGGKKSALLSSISQKSLSGVFWNEKKHEIRFLQEIKDQKGKLLINSESFNNERTWFTWDTKTGLVLSDHLADYKIDLPKITQTNEITGKKEKVIDEEGFASVRRKFREGGRSEKWDYNYQNGVLKVKVGPDFEEYKVFYILASGANYNKIRKVDKLVGKEFVTVVRNAYDETGRLIREIDEKGKIVLH